MMDLHLKAGKKLHMAMQVCTEFILDTVHNIILCSGLWLTVTPYTTQILKIALQ